jgi:hypothetical protein
VHYVLKPDTSRRATKPAGQWPYGWVVYCSGTAGLRPNCDHIGGHSLSDCDHLRPPWLMPAPLLLVSATVEAPARDRLWVLRFDIHERASSPKYTATVSRRVRAS